MWSECYHYPRCCIVGSLKWRLEVRHLARCQSRYGRINDLELKLVIRGASQCNPQPRYFAGCFRGIENISFDHQTEGSARGGKLLDFQANRIRFGCFPRRLTRRKSDPHNPPSNPLSSKYSSDRFGRISRRFSGFDCVFIEICKPCPTDRYPAPLMVRIFPEQIHQTLRCHKAINELVEHGRGDCSGEEHSKNVS